MSFLINAANPNTFPFLSQIAANYEQYEIEGLIFEFRSTSADALNSTNTALGSVMMATQYDVLDALFASKLDMLNYEYSTSCKPSCNVLHMVECDPHQTPVSELYTVYNQSLPPNADPRLYHLGRFSIATTGFQGTNVNIGELHITYQVRLLKPKMFVSLGFAENYLLQIYGDNTTGGIYTNNKPFGIPAPTTNFFNNLGFFIDNQNINLPPSFALLNYRIELHWSGSTAASLNPPTLVATNCTIVNQENDLVVTATATQGIMLLGVQTFANGLTPNINATPGTAVLPAGNQNFIIRIMQVTPQFNAG